VILRTGEIGKTAKRIESATGIEVEIVTEIAEEGPEAGTPEKAAVNIAREAEIGIAIGVGEAQVVIGGGEGMKRMKNWKWKSGKRRGKLPL